MFDNEYQLRWLITGAQKLKYRLHYFCDHYLRCSKQVTNLQRERAYLGGHMHMCMPGIREKIFVSILITVQTYASKSVCSI